MTGSQLYITIKVNVGYGWQHYENLIFVWQEPPIVGYPVWISLPEQWSEKQNRGVQDSQVIVPDNEMSELKR